MSILKFDRSRIRNILRRGSNPSLKNRRKIIILSAIGILDFIPISLYQSGNIKKLPDLPFRIFDSNKVNASKEAYPLGIPDGPITLTLYALTILFASAGGIRKTGRARLFDHLMAGAVLGGAGGAVQYMYDMIFDQKKICIYCVTGAAVNFIMLPYLFKIYISKK